MIIMLEYNSRKLGIPTNLSLGFIFLSYNFMRFNEFLMIWIVDL